MEWIHANNQLISEIKYCHAMSTLDKPVSRDDA